MEKDNEIKYIIDGPLITDEGMAPLPMACAPEPLYMYDPDSGGLNISYANAWQLGRKLIHDHTVLKKALIVLRKRNLMSLQRQYQRKIIMAARRGTTNQEDLYEIVG